jgi:cation diffusion facilitator family transporter
MRARDVQRVVFAILWMNLAVAVAKGVYGFWSGSLAVASDAVHSLLDAASNIVGLVALRLAATPPDEGHPYGHHKIEIVAAAIVGILIAGGSLRFAWDAVNALIHGRHAPEVSVAGYITMGGTLAVNLFVASYEARRGRQLGFPPRLMSSGEIPCSGSAASATKANRPATRNHEYFMNSAP